MRAFQPVQHIELSRDAFYNLKFAPQHLQQATATLQVLQTLEEGQVVLSDGESKAKVVAVQAKRPVLSTQVKAGHILSCALKYFKEHFFLLDFDILSTAHTEVIGEPSCFDPRITPDRVRSPRVGIAARRPDHPAAQSSHADPLPMNISSIQTKIADLKAAPSAVYFVARISYKSQIYDYSTGKCFTAVLFDETGQIELVFFNEHCTRFFPLLEEDKVYHVINPTVKPCSIEKTITGNSLGLTFSNRSTIKQANEYDQEHFTRLPPAIGCLADLQAATRSKYVSFIARVEKIGEPQVKPGRFSAVCTMTAVTVSDQEGNTTNINLWDAPKIEAGFAPDKICLFQSLKKTLWNGTVCVSTCSLSRIVTSLPEHLPQVEKIRELEEKRKTDPAFTLHDLNGVKRQDHYSIEQIQTDSQLLFAVPGKKLFFNTEAIVVDFGQFQYYDSCVNENCLKKVIPDLEHGFTCPRCGALPEGTTPAPRYMGRVKIQDKTGSVWATYCTETLGRMIFGLPSSKIKELSTIEGDLEKFALTQMLSARKLHMYRLSLTPKLNEYNQETSIQYFISSMEPIPSDLASEEMYSVLMDLLRSSSKARMRDLESAESARKSSQLHSANYNESREEDSIESLSAPQKQLKVA